MANTVSAEIQFEGLAELEKALTDLPKAMQEEILGAALAAGGDVIRVGAIRRIRRRTGQTADSLHVEVQARAAGLLSKVGGAAAIGSTPKREHVLRFLEFGTKPHQIPKPGRRKKKLKVGGKVVSRVQHPGTRPQAPLTSALAEDGGKAIEAFSDEAWKRIEEFAVKSSQATSTSVL